MKTSKIIYSFLAGLILFASCRKDDNPVVPDNVQKAPVPQFSIDSSADLTISGQDPNSFTGKFTLTQYFQNDHSYKSFDIVVRKNGDNSSVKVIQANITSLPATITITGDQLKTLFNADIMTTDFYDIGADIILSNDAKLEAFPSDGISNYDPNVNTFPNLKPLTLQYGVFCDYDPSVYDGNFVVVQDDWADYHPGDVVPVTKIDETHFSFKYAAADAQPIIVEVNPANNTTSVANQYFGNYGVAFGNWFAKTDNTSPNNFVLPCQQVFSVVLDLSSDNPGVGDQGNFRVVMRKQ